MLSPVPGSRVFLGAPRTGHLGFLPADPGLTGSRGVICSGNTHHVSEISLEEHLGQLRTEKDEVHIGSECDIICRALTTEGQQESSVTTERKREGKWILLLSHEVRLRHFSSCAKQQ